jgi:catecholate siderophore receptor
MKKTKALSFIRWVVGAGFLAGLAVPLAADPLAAGATVRGRVSDPSGAPLPGAQVAAASGGQKLAATGTDWNGHFSLSLAPGSYTLIINASGFAEARREVVVTGAQTVSIAIELQILPRTDMVTVTETAGYETATTNSATRTPTPLINVPQAVSVVTSELIRDQMMTSIGDVVRYVPGLTAVQGENNRDQVVIRGNSSSADFFVNGLRDDVQYFRDVYNLERVEALKGPNAMTFGRGGGGGVINRVTKEPGFADLREFNFQGGMFGNKRVATDWNHPFGPKAAVRFNGMYENSDSFRRYVNLERYGLNPTATFLLTPQTRITASYEYFRDRRTADRGIPSFAGRPSDVPIETFFGNPSDSHVRANVHLGSMRMERQFGRLNLRNATLVADYDRGYQNYVPGAVSEDRTAVALSAYNNATSRRNLFNQTDLSLTAHTGAVRHTLLWGAELGRQSTGNFRNTGYFDGNRTSVQVPYDNPTIPARAVFRQSATDADNHVGANIAAGYVQDQIELSRFFQVLAGVRVDRFDLLFHNRRGGPDLGRVDHLISPRAGLVFKPAAEVSVYGSYSVSWLPSSGDQFGSLTTVTQQLKPEKFSNYEAGIKWDVRRSLSMTTAVYRLDRTNTRAVDPNEPTRILQTGSQRTNGVEVGLNGAVTPRWSVAGGYSYQDAFVLSATASAPAGAQVAQAPHHTFSFWNHYRMMARLSGGLGILNRSDMYAGIDNTVTLPGFVRADAAVYYSLSERMRVQVNVENLFDRRYYVNANGNNNISPGYPRAVRAGLVVRF